MAAILSRPRWVNSLWPSDAGWSALAQVMDWYRQAASHSLDQC